MTLKSLGRVFKKFKPPDWDGSYSSPDSSSSSNSRESPASANKHRNRRQPSPPPGKSRSPRQRTEGSTSRIPLQTTSRGAAGLGIHYDKDNRRSPRDGSSSGRRPERATPASNSQRQRHRALDTSPSRIPHPRRSAQGYPTRRETEFPPPSPPTPDCGSSPISLPGVAPYRLGAAEDIQTAEDAIYIAAHRKEAYAMLEGKILTKAFNMAEYIAWRRDFKIRNTRESVYSCQEQQAQYILPPVRQPPWLQVPAREPADPKARTESMKARLADIKNMMEQNKQAAQNPKARSPPAPRLPASPPRQPARKPQGSAPSREEGSLGHRRAASRTARQQEEDDMQAAIAASLADADMDKRRRGREEGTSTSRPGASAYQKFRQAVEDRMPAAGSSAKAWGRKPAATKSTAEQEDEDFKAAMAASLADAEARDQRRRAQGETFRLPQRPARPDVRPRAAAELPRYMSSTGSQRSARGPQPSAGARAPEPRTRAPERPARGRRPAPPPIRTGYVPDTPPPVPPRSHLRGHPRDATTGQYLSEDAWNAQVL